MNAKQFYPYALHALALSAALSVVAILPASAQQGGKPSADSTKLHGVNESTSAIGLANDGPTRCVSTNR